MATKTTSRNGASQKSSGGKSSAKKSGSSRSESMGRHGRGSSSKSKSTGNGSSSSKSSPEQAGQDQGIMSKATGGIRDAGSKVYDTIRQHPIAASLVGAGITAGVAILAVRAIRGISDQQGEEDQQGDEGQDQMDSGDAEGSAEGEEGQEGEDEGGEEEGEGDSDDEDDICSRGKFWQRHPLAIGAGLMGLGTAAGMLLPSTGIEKKLFGSASDKFTDRFKSAGQKLFKQGKQMASKVISETGSALSEEAEREGLSPDKLATKVTRIAGRLKDVVAHAVED